MEEIGWADATCDIPIIFVTASVIGAEMKLITALRISGYISKPIDTRTFAEDVARFMKVRKCIK